MTKKEARNLINKHFNNLSKKRKKNLDSRILSNFLEFVDISKCKKIGSYFSLFNEANTDHINDFLTKTGIQIFLPKIPEEKDTKKLSFFRYIKKDKLTKNRFGILNLQKNENPSDINDLDLILVPFRAVNKKSLQIRIWWGFL